MFNWVGHMKMCTNNQKLSLAIQYQYSSELLNDELQYMYVCNVQNLILELLSTNRVWNVK